MRAFNRRLIFLLAVGALAPTLIGAAGCSSADTVGSAQQAIVNGVTTWAHPEIGMFRINGGAFCTGTLLSAHAGITAAHCFDYSDVNSIDALFTFEIFDTNGTSQGQWAVDRVKSLTTEAANTWVDGHNTRDVAVFHLTTDVSALIATPGTVASAPPTEGELATVYGFGCTQRFTPTGVGAGTKRYAPFAYGTQTGMLCPGDSGGPAVRGNLQAPISVWGVNSGWTSGDGTTDIWGGAFVFRDSIASILVDWNHIVEPWTPAFPVIFG